MATPIEQIKDRLSIVDVVSGYVKLEKAGVNWKGRCPFHNEKTPSFFVSPGRQSFHCFGCTKGGDIFTFVQEIEGLDFPEALRLLAGRANVVLEPRSGAREVADVDAREKEYLRRVLEVATRYFQKRLSEQGSVKTYLADRGVSSASIEAFRIGFAPDGWRNLVEFCAEQNIRKDMLVKAGLAIQNPKNPSEYYDRFRGRIMFPLMDREGRVVGFSGRVFDPDNLRNDEAKYVNTPQTLLYDKSRILYGYHLAKTAIRTNDRCVLVEGQMDLVMSHQTGVAEAVAVSGTALTEWHLGIIKRIASKLVMAFDADAAGIKASSRALRMALALGFEVRIAALPAGQDPADVAKTEPEAWRTAVDKAVHAIDFYLSLIRQKFGNDSRAKGAMIREEVYPLVAVLAHKIDQAYFIRRVAEELGIAEDVVWQDVREYTRANPTIAGSTPETLKQPVWVDAATSSRLQRVEERIVATLWWLEEKDKEDSLAQETRTKLADRYQPTYLQTLEERFSGIKGALLLELDILYETTNVPEEVIRLLHELAILKLKDDLAQTTTLLKEAERAENHELIDKYVKKCQDISKSIKELTS